MTKSERDRNITHAIEDWYLTYGTDFPWRKTRDPYQVWVAAVMLQQTQIATVLPYYHRFTTAFPDVKSLSKANIDSVLKQWEGLGYYTRAHNLHRAAKEIVTRYNGVFPDTYEKLQTLPGIGAYTAATVASIGFKQPVPVLDSVTIRMNLRLDRSPLNPRLSSTVKSLYKRVLSRVKNANDPGIFNLGAMELGSQICQPKAPKCNKCAVLDYCRAYQSGHPERIPKPHKKQAIPHYNIAAGLIWKNEKILIAKRPENKMLGGLWEFPGGKQEVGETLEQCLAREILEELGIRIEVEAPFMSVNHAYSHFKITLHTFNCRVKNGNPRNLEVADYAWVTPHELSNFAFPSADVKISKALKKKIT